MKASEISILFYYRQSNYCKRYLDRYIQILSYSGQNPSPTPCQQRRAQQDNRNIKPQIDIVNKKLGNEAFIVALLFSFS